MPTQPSKPGVNPSPFAWHEAQAWNLPTMLDAIARNNKNSNMPNEMLAVIFFEETGFCNVQQAGKNGPAVGFGQIEVGNRDKFRFYKWLNDPDLNIPDEFMAKLKQEKLDLPTLKMKQSIQEKVKTKMLGSKEYSAMMSCKYFEFLSTVDGMQLEGLIGAQISSHTEYRTRFSEGYQLLRKALNLTGVTADQLRDELINALNHAKRRGAGESLSNKNNPIPKDNFKSFWNWILPADWLAGRPGVAASASMVSANATNSLPAVR